MRRKERANERKCLLQSSNSLIDTNNKHNYNDMHKMNMNKRDNINSTTKADRYN